MNAQNDRILIVDDEFLITEVLSAMVEDMSMMVCGCAGTAEEAVLLAEEHRPWLVLMDVRLKGPNDGVDAALVIHKSVGAKVIFITGSREPSTVARIEQDHPADVLFKPITFEQLRRAVQRVAGSGQPAP
ncbi:MAG TPA: response regulator [Geminicoccus sp.]|jgi:DNA-binding NarL/FixJ family response regulator|uniref:response regulator n=1 Tax=Geminicoccus sp. TaxID=2024832 RepID=UPI002E33EB5F|nr:response regulator [Geminicoccus sp.]HEX2528434.1 response regulator [Geminicoccus sp.]